MDVVGMMMVVMMMVVRVIILSAARSSTERTDIVLAITASPHVLHRLERLVVQLELLFAHLHILVVVVSVQPPLVLRIRPNRPGRTLRSLRPTQVLGGGSAWTLPYGTLMGQLRLTFHRSWGDAVRLTRIVAPDAPRACHEVTVGSDVHGELGLTNGRQALRV